MRRRVPLAAGALSVAGLTIAPGATLPPTAPTEGAPGASLVIRLPDAVRFTVLALLALSAIIVLALARLERRRASELERHREARRLPRWAAALLSLPVMLPIATLAYLAWSRSASHFAGRIEGAHVGRGVVATHVRHWLAIAALGTAASALVLIGGTALRVAASMAPLPVVIMAGALGAVVTVVGVLARVTRQEREEDSRC